MGAPESADGEEEEERGSDSRDPSKGEGGGNKGPSGDDKTDHNSGGDAGGGRTGGDSAGDLGGGDAEGKPTTLIVTGKMVANEKIGGCLQGLRNNGVTRHKNDGLAYSFTPAPISANSEVALWSLLRIGGVPVSDMQGLIDRLCHTPGGPQTIFLVVDNRNDSGLTNSVQRDGRVIATLKAERVTPLVTRLQTSASAYVLTSMAANVRLQLGQFVLGRYQPWRVQEAIQKLGKGACGPVFKIQSLIISRMDGSNKTQVVACDLPSTF
ncbi:hypothetical protein BCY86_03265 [Pajaroellobacter abortibovis]|uniref:Uncharacterized protein n=1 Tax=Pajaroellobacter abortibovis TaxID=1882918 RepID=A0A1L6MWE9_9BACT|nr:hypothetical protein BCY86_03265 [Pajaroellobacter abortibovis]